jgi:hypothetical protein
MLYLDVECRCGCGELLIIDGSVALIMVENQDSGVSRGVGCVLMFFVLAGWLGIV